MTEEEVFRKRNKSPPDNYKQVCWQACIQTGAFASYNDIDKAFSPTLKQMELSGSQWTAMCMMKGEDEDCLKASDKPG